MKEHIRLKKEQIENRIIDRLDRSINRLDRLMVGPGESYPRVATNRSHMRIAQSRPIQAMILTNGKYILTMERVSCHI